MLWLLLRVVDTFTTSGKSAPPDMSRRGGRLPVGLDPSTHVAPKGELVQPAGVRAHVRSFRAPERGEMETLGTAPQKNPHPEFPPY